MSQTKTALSVVIPTFNDIEGLIGLIPRLKTILQAACKDWEIVVVDDGSPQPIGLPNLHDKHIRIIRNEQNRGYGASIKRGIRNSQFNWVLIMDADGQHNPDDIPKFINKSEASDIVVGTRMGGKGNPLWRRPGKWFLKLMVNILSPYPLKDINCGYRLFKKDVILKYMHLCSDKFSFALSSTLLGLSFEYEFKFVDIEVGQRIGKSTVSIKTGLDTIILILRMIVLSNPLRIFIPTSSILVLFGIAWGIPYAINGKGLSIGAFLLISSGMMIFFLGIISDQIKSVIKNEVLR